MWLKDHVTVKAGVPHYELHHPAKFAGHDLSRDTTRWRNSRAMRLYGNEPLKLYHHPAKLVAIYTVAVEI